MILLALNFVLWRETVRSPMPTMVCFRGEGTLEGRAMWPQDRFQGIERQFQSLGSLAYET